MTHTIIIENRILKGSFLSGVCYVFRYFRNWMEWSSLNEITAAKLHAGKSGIFYWLKQHNKRQVQYMADHKYISNTERYEVMKLESLTDALSKHHPFG